MRVLSRELALGVGFVLLGVLLFVDGYDLLTIWLETRRCTWGMACTVQVIYSPILPWLLFTYYLALFLLAAFGGWWSYEDWQRIRRAKARRTAWRLTGAVLLFSVSAWSAALWLLAALGGFPPVLWGPASDLIVLAFYAFLVAMPLITVGIGLGMTVHAVRRRSAPGA